MDWIVGRGGRKERGRKHTNCLLYSLCKMELYREIDCPVDSTANMPVGR